MANEAYAILTALRNEWHDWTASMKRLGPISISPEDQTAVMRTYDEKTDESSIGISFGKVALNVSERLGIGPLGLFVCLEGYFQFDRQAWGISRRLEAVKVGARAAYYRLKERKNLELVYALHCDHSPSESRHPVFHAQVDFGMEDFAMFVQQQFRLSGTHDERIRGILRGARVPCAQMDAFSLLLQISADHLLGSSSSESQRREFNKLKARDVLCTEHCRDGGGGNAQPIPSSTPTAQYRCFRARHWYPDC